MDGALKLWVVIVAVGTTSTFETRRVMFPPNLRQIILAPSSHPIWHSTTFPSFM